VVTVGLIALLAGIVSLIVALDVGAGPEIVTIPLLLAGLGVGALASQLGAVTVSAVPDELSGEVGGLQNTSTNLGASLGTALAGSVLISVLTTSALIGLASHPNVSEQVSSAAAVQLSSGIPFVSDNQLRQTLEQAGLPDSEIQAVVEVNAKARIEALRVSLAVLAVLAMLATFLTRLLPAAPAADD
jgi:MFS family permease